MSEEDKEQKTEQPTQKRVEDAHKKGQYAVSRELGHFFILLVGALVIGSILPGMVKDAKVLLTPFIVSPDLFEVDRKGVSDILRRVATEALLLLLVPLVASVVAGIGANVLQNGLVFNNEAIMPKFEKISPMKGFKRIFSMRSVVEFAKGIVKIGILGYLCWLSFESALPVVMRLPDMDAPGLLDFISHAAVKLMIWVCVAMFFIALADVLYQRFEFTKSLRMSKQEIRDEYKQQEGDPHIKGRLRQIRMERARKRMMADVPGADVVITNPTHYAVALKYDAEKKSAPFVVAKGIEYHALTIRRIAEEHGITIMENPPLARALYASVEIDEEIPVEHYKAVAEIISYVYKLKGKVPVRRA